MSFVAKIEARAYSRATEVPDRVVMAILNLFPERVRELVFFEASKVEGHSGDEILIIESILEDRENCETALDYIFERLEKRDQRHLLNSLSRRIEKNCTLFVRIDKQAAFLDDIVLAKGPDVISVQVHIRKYPKCKQDDAKKMLEDRFRAAGGDE